MKGQEFTIYEVLSDEVHVSADQWPGDIDFKVGTTARLHPKHTLVKGELQETTYYVEADLQPDGSIIYTTPAVKETFTYVRDTDLFALSRTQVLSWFYTDGTESPEVKTLVKLYDMPSRLREGQRRRKNIVDNTMMNLLGLMLVTLAAQYTREEIFQEGREFAKAHKLDIDTYVSEYNKTLVTSVIGDQSFIWLDAANPLAPQSTLRQYILSTLI